MRRTITPMRTRASLAPALALVIAASTPAWAQPEEPPLLAGPHVDAPNDAGSIVDRSFDGEMRPLDRPAELEALDRLDLDEPTAHAVNAALEERAAIVDRLLADNLALFAQVRTQLQAARGGGPGQDEGARAARSPEFREVMGQFRTAIEPLTARGPLAEEISRLLPPDDRARFDQLLAEYQSEVMADRRSRAEARGGLSLDAGPDAQPDPMGPDDAQARPQRARAGRFAERARGAAPAFRSYLEEFRYAYDRVVVQRSDDFEATLARMGLSPELESKLRSAVQRSVETDGLDPADASRRDTLRRLLEDLEPDERREVLDALRRERSRQQAP